MTERANERFDCIRFVREVRAEIALETAGMNSEELIRYYRSYPFNDPVLERLAAPLSQKGQNSASSEDCRGNQ